MAVGWLSLAEDMSTPSNWSESLGLLSVGFSETGGWSSVGLKKENASLSKHCVELEVAHVMAHLHILYVSNVVDVYKVLKLDTPEHQKI